MSVVDIIMAVVIVVAIVYGYYKGLLSQMGALAGILAGVICCRLFGDVAADYFNNLIGEASSSNSSVIFLNNIVAYVVVFLLAYLSIRLVASLLTKILKAINLGVINRIAGAVFAVVQGLLILSLLLNLWIAIFPDTELLKESSGAVEQRLINLAPDLLGSDTAQEFLNATKELAK